MKTFTAIIGFLALAVAGTAAFFSVRGIGLLFAGAAIAAMVMAGVLEAGKLAMTSFFISLLGTNSKNVKMVLHCICCCFDRNNLTWYLWIFK